MRNRIGNVLWGAAFIIAGVGFAGNAFNLWDFHLFFHGWWTLFIIVPALISMIQSGPNTGNIIALLFGGFLLLSAQDIIDSRLVGKLFLPALLVIIGLSILLGGRRRPVQPAAMPGGEIPVEAAGSMQGAPSYSGIFSGCQVRWPAQPFPGANLTAVFGSVELDLRDAVFNENTVINATAIFGGMDIRVPAHVRVAVSGMPVFGGVDNRAGSAAGPDAPLLQLNTSCAFGGIDIK